MKVTSQADLPRFTYPVKGSASDLLQSDDATFRAFASKVRADLDSTFRDYKIDDKATLRLLLQAKLDLEQLAGQNEAALGTVASLRAEEEKPAARLTTGLFTSAVLKAEIETKSSSGIHLAELRDPNLTARSHRHIYAFPRQLAMYIARQLTGATLQEIGRQFGGMHHSTVLHSINKVERMRRLDEGLNVNITRLTDALPRR
jgi:hypothetical protein